MPLTWHFDDSSSITFFRASGSLRRDEVISALSAVYNDPGLKGPLLTLWDMREATINWTPDDIQEVIEFIRTHRRLASEGRSAMVAPESVSQEVAEAYRKFLARVPVVQLMFPSVEEALAWLLEGQPGLSAPSS